MDARFRQEAPTDLLVAVRPAQLVADAAPSRRSAGRSKPRRASVRRPGLLLGALLAGGVAAAVTLQAAPSASAGSTTVLAAQEALLSGEQGTEAMPMASVTVAEAQARLNDVAASRAARAQSETAAQVAAQEAARPKTVLPIHGAHISSCFCARWGTFHYGIDFAAPMRTPEYAAADGVVLRAGAASGFGLAVYVLHDGGDVTVYGHMDSILVKPGQYVQAGDTIALLGMRGESTGPHLHFEVHKGGINGKRIDPLPWLRARGVDI